MGEQAAEAAVGAAVLVVLAGCLRVGVPGSAGGGDGVRLRRRVLVSVGQRCPGLAEVPGEVGGEHADQHVAPDAFLQAVMVTSKCLAILYLPMTLPTAVPIGEARCRGRRDRPSRRRVRG